MAPGATRLRVALVQKDDLRANNGIFSSDNQIDVLSGGPGNDSYYVATEDQVVETVGEGFDTANLYVNASSYTLAANVENLIVAGGNYLTFTEARINGNAADNVITSSPTGSLVLDGGAGADTLVGNEFGTKFHVDNVGDVVVAGVGTDTVISSLDWTLGAGLENLTLTGNGAINGTGNALANTITGNVANNVLSGGPGNDTFVFAPGFGNDTVQDFDFDPVGGQDLLDISALGVTAATYAGSIVITDLGVDLRISIGADSIVLTNVADTAAITQADFILASGSVNVINGTSGDDTLIGTAAADRINGLSGNDAIDGGLGADLMVGGSGNDSYTVDDVGDSITENPGEGTDTVLSSVNYTLGSNVERLTLTGSAINGTGNELNNTLTGNSATNVLDGRSGNDTLYGGTGNDTCSAVPATTISMAAAASTR